MAKLTVRIEEEGYGAEIIDGEAMPKMTAELSFGEIGYMNELEGVFLKVAHLMGFDYVGRVDCQKRATSMIEGDELGSYERKKLERLLGCGCGGSDEEVV